MSELFDDFRFVDDETKLDQDNLNKILDACDRLKEQPASATSFGGIKIKVTGTTLYISTNNNII